MHDLDGRFLYVNERTLAMHGYDLDEYMALDLRQVTAPSAFAGIADRIAEIRRDGEAEFEVDHLRKDGSIVPLAVTARFTTWGGREAILRISRDITERRAVERALVESKAELEEAQRVAHVGSWTWDPRTGEITWSDEMFRIFALDPGSRAPTLAEQESFHPPEAYVRLGEEFARTARTGVGYEFEHDVVRRDGSVRHVVDRGEAVRDADGVVTRVRGTAVDVTELHQAQARADQASRAEMVGRLAGGVAHDFNNLLTAIGG